MKYFYAILTSISLASVFFILNFKEAEIEYYDMSEYEIIITPSKN